MKMNLVIGLLLAILTVLVFPYAKAEIELRQDLAETWAKVKAIDDRTCNNASLRNVNKTIDDSCNDLGYKDRP